MNKAYLLLPLATLLLAPCCIAARSSNRHHTEQQGLEQRIINGIKHYRTSPLDAAVEIDYQAPQPRYSNLVCGPVQLAFAQKKYANDSPNSSDSRIYWISKNGNLSFDTHDKANLAADHGDSTWYEVASRLVVRNGFASVLFRYRMRTPDGKNGYTEKYAWSGNIHLHPLQSRASNQFNIFDPRTLAYFVNFQGLDQLLKDRTYSAAVVNTGTLYGSHCAQIVLKKTLSDGSAFKIQCWVDLDHDFLVREVRETHEKAGRKSGVFLDRTVPGVLKTESGWLPSSYVQHSFMNSKTAQGKMRPTRMLESVTIQPIPSNYEPGKAPFSIHWPDGTYVKDSRTNKEYCAQKDGGLKLARPSGPMLWQLPPSQ